MLLIAMALCARFAFAAPPIAITGGTLIDGNGGQPVATATALIRDDTIVAAGATRGGAGAGASPRRRAPATPPPTSSAPRARGGRRSVRPDRWRFPPTRSASM